MTLYSHFVIYYDPVSKKLCSDDEVAAAHFSDGLIFDSSSSEWLDTGSTSQLMELDAEASEKMRAALDLFNLLVESGEPTPEEPTP